MPVLAVLRISANLPLASGVSWQCLMGSAHQPPDLIALAGLLSHPASSDPGEVLPGRPMIDAPTPALFARVPSVRLGTVPVVSCGAGVYGRLLLETHERMVTGGLVSCDCLRPVTRGWRGVWLLQLASRHTPL